MLSWDPVSPENIVPVFRGRYGFISHFGACCRLSIQPSAVIPVFGAEFFRNLENASMVSSHQTISVSSDASAFRRSSCVAFVPWTMASFESAARSTETHGPVPTSAHYRYTSESRRDSVVQRYDGVCWLCESALAPNVMALEVAHNVDASIEPTLVGNYFSRSFFLSHPRHLLTSRLSSRSFDGNSWAYYPGISHLRTQII